MIVHSFVVTLSVSWVLLCLTIENQSQIKSSDSRIRQGASAVPKEGVSNWQTILLSGKGIKFKLPPDWKREVEDSEKTNEYFTLEANSWASPNKELIRIHITTSPKGFMSLNRTVISREGRLEEEFKSVKRSAKSDANYSDVKKLKVGGVVGVFKRLRIDFEDKDTGERVGIIWKGYRIYQGKAQELDISISAHPKSEGLLHAILNTFEMEQDKDANAKP